MLHFIRESIQGWIAWAIVILLIVPFALWGINSYFGNGGSLVIASVNGEEISRQAYTQEYYQQRNRLQQMLGAQYDPSMFDKRIKNQALDDLVQKEVLLQNAQSLGFRVGAQSVISSIQSFEAFQDNGKFSNELYKRQLTSQGESPAGFEQRIQRAILSQQLYAGITATAIMTKQEIDAILQLQEQKRDIDHFLLAKLDYKKTEDASDEAILAYYNGHQNQYMTVEKISVEYIELSADNLSVDEMPSEEELKQYYQDRNEQFKGKEQRRTRHILVEIENDAKEEVIQAALQKAKDIKARIDKGEDFEALAKKYSQDPGSAEKGGDLGYFGAGLLDPNYDKAMFALKPGEVSEPTLTAFGYHIIRLENIKGGTSQSFESVREELIQEYKKSAKEKKYFAESEKLTNLAYEVPDTLDDAAGAIGVDVKTTELFERNRGTGIASNPKVRAAAFGDDVLNNHYNSEPIEIGENRVVVIRIKEHQEPSQRPLEEVKAQILVSIVDKKSRERAKDEGEKLLSKLSSSEDANKVIQEIQKQWIKSGEVTRSETKIDKAIVNKAFKLSAPSEGKVVFGGMALPSGDYAIVRLNSVTTPEVASIPAEKRQSLSKELAGIVGEADFSNMLSSLKSASRIIIQEDNL